MDATTNGGTSCAIEAPVSVRYSLIGQRAKGDVLLKPIGYTIIFKDNAFRIHTPRANSSVTLPPWEMAAPGVYERSIPRNAMDYSYSRFKYLKHNVYEALIVSSTDGYEDVTGYLIPESNPIYNFNVLYGELFENPHNLSLCAMLEKFLTER